jgi:hypothetical protein
MLEKRFELYAEKTSDAQLRSLLHEMIENKQRHIQMLEKRLSDWMHLSLFLPLRLISTPVSKTGYTPVMTWLSCGAH